MAAANASLWVRPQGGRGSFGLFSHDVRPSLNCRTHERTFFTSITPSLHVSFNCRWISIGFVPRKWRNRIITRCSSNINVAISVSKTLLQLGVVTSIEWVVQCCQLISCSYKQRKPNAIFTGAWYWSLFCPLLFCTYHYTGNLTFRNLASHIWDGRKITL